MKRRHAVPSSSFLAPLGAFRSPGFRSYIAGQCISLLGSWIQRIAQNWVAFALTHSPFWLGVIACVASVPMLILAPFAGVLADRFPRKTLFLLTQAIEMVAALILAVLMFRGLIRIEHLIALSLCFGVTTALGEPARQALLSDLVDRDAIASGLALNATMNNLAGVLGSALAGILLVQVGTAWCFLLNSLSYLAVIASLFFVHVPLQEKKQESHRAHLQHLRNGFRFAQHHRTIAPLLLLALVVNLFGINPITTLLPAFASLSLHVSQPGYALLNAALLGGSVLASLLNVWVGQSIGRGRLIVIVSLLLPLGGILLALMKAMLPATVLIGALGIGFTLFFVTCNTLIQKEVPNEYRGRVMSLWSMIRFGLAPVSILGLAAFAQLVSTMTTFIVCSIVSGVFCAWIILLAPDLRSLHEEREF